MKNNVTNMTALFYNDSLSDGAGGMNFEQFVRYYLTDVFEGVHAADKTDVAVKERVALECKTGAGQLTAANMSSEEAAALLDSFKMKKAMHVAYAPTWTYTTIGECMAHLDEIRVYTQKTFLSIMKEHGKLRIKKASNGFYCVAIQNYIPTPKFRASKKVYASILHELATKGESLEEYRLRLLGK